MSKHKASAWMALKEELAQCEYEREDARRQWAANRERADKAERRIAELEAAIKALKPLLRLVGRLK